MAVMNSPTKSVIFYFESEGRDNLEEVLKVLKKTLRAREDLRGLKIVVFTAEGRGPALAYNRLGEFSPKMIAVTFPRGFSVRNAEGRAYCPRIADTILKFFRGVEIEVIVPPRLPFDLIDGMDGHNQQMQLIRKTIAMFGSGFELCLQAVICACDAGHIEEGESVIVFSGDTAGLVVSSSTKHFLNPQRGLGIQEIFCKPRRLTISRPKPKEPKESAPALPVATPKTLEGEKV
jgi:hypothetical protein